MDHNDKPPEEAKRSMTVSWPHDQWERIESAARILSEQEHFEVTPTDIIRSGAVRRADDVHASAGKAQAA